MCSSDLHLGAGTTCHPAFTLLHSFHLSQETPSVSAGPLRLCSPSWDCSLPPGTALSTPVTALSLLRCGGSCYHQTALSRKQRGAFHGLHCCPSCIFLTSACKQSLGMGFLLQLEQHGFLLYSGVVKLSHCQA